MADTGGPAQPPGLEARGAGFEADVAHIRDDVGDIKTTLNRLTPLIDEFRGFMAATLPTLATRREVTELRAELKTEISELRAELKTEMAELRSELHLEIAQRPTRRQSVFDVSAIVGLIGAILAIASHFAQ
jgi:hypothetical protein